MNEFKVIEKEKELIVRVFEILHISESIKITFRVQRPLEISPPTGKSWSFQNSYIEQISNNSSTWMYEANQI